MKSQAHTYQFVKRIVWALAILSLLVLLTPQVHAVDSGGVGGRPAKPDPNNKRTESIFLFTVDAGQKATNSVKIYNTTNTKKTIDVYPVDSQVSSGGAFACAQKADEQREVGSWLKLAKQSVAVDANSSQDIDFTLNVPDNATPGEHNGCIAIQQSDQTPQAAGNGIALSFRSAIRVSVTVKGDLRKGIAFTRLENKPGKPGMILINTALRNSGNVSLDTDVDVRIKSILGTTVSKTGGEFPVLAGGESEFNFETGEPFWGGLYFLTAKATYNPNPQASLGDNSQQASITTRRVLLTAPKPLALVIELLTLVLLVGGGIFFFRRRKTHKQWRSKGKIYVVKDGDNIQKIAEKYGVDWKTLARVNKLKAPYHLETGQHLKLLPKINIPKPKQAKTEHKPKK